MPSDDFFRRGEAHLKRGGPIQDHRVERVTGHYRGKRPSGDESQAKGFLEISGYEQGRNPDLFIFRLICQSCRENGHYGGACHASRHQPGSSNRLNGRALRKALLQGVETPLRASDQGYDDDLVLVETQLPVLHVIQLLIHRRRTDDQQDRQRELCNHETLAQHGTRNAARHFTLEDLRRMKPGEKQRGITAGKQSHKQRDARQPQQQFRVLQVTDLKRRSHQRVEPGQDGYQEADGHEKSQSGRTHGLAHILQRQLGPRRADRLPDGHFFCTDRGPCRGKIHEVDTGDQHD